MVSSDASPPLCLAQLISLGLRVHWLRIGQLFVVDEDGGYTFELDDNCLCRSDFLRVN